MNLETVGAVAAFMAFSGIFSLGYRVQQQQSSLRRLDKKLNALLKANGTEWPSLSAEVQSLALNPSKKIAAIKMHRDENSGMSIAEAKADIEDFAATR